MADLETDIRDLEDVIGRLKDRGYNPRVVMDNEGFQRMAKRLRKAVRVHQHPDCNLYAGFWFGRVYIESEGGV